MAQTNPLSSRSSSRPSRLSPSSLSIGEGGKAVAAQPSSLDTEEGSEHKLLIDEYRECGTLWTWPTNTIPVAMTMEFKENKNLIHILECWKFDFASESHLSPINVFKEIKEDEIEAWVNTETPTKEGFRPVAGYKILQVDESRGFTVPLRSKTYRALIEGFKLPAVELRNWSNHGACGVFKEEDGSILLINRRRFTMNAISTIFRYDRLTNVTFGYIITDHKYPGYPSAMFNLLHTQFLACPHPILLPILIIEQDLSDQMEWIFTANHELRLIEKATGFTYSEAKKVEDDRQLSDTVRKLGTQHGFYSGIETSLLVLRRAIATFKGKMEYVDSEGLPDAAREKLTKYAGRLRDRIEYIESMLENAILFGNIPTRLQAQQQVLFNLIAQADNKINIGLAKDSREIAAASKQDSSAMKIIAVLTTLFLPGTFIATLFAMPLFDWQEPSISHITNQHFWIYWAVTGPLTLVTLVLVISWAVWHRSSLRAEVSRARMDIDGEAPASLRAEVSRARMNIDGEAPADNYSGNMMEGEGPGVESGSRSMDVDRGEKWFDKAFLRRRLLRTRGKMAQQDDLQV